MPKAKIPDVPVSFLRVCLDYDPETGLFNWRSRPLSHFNDPRVHVRWNRYRVGTSAFRPTKGRRYLRATVTYQGVEIELLAHRVAWAFVTGEWPTDEIDHIDCETWNTRFSNLREATRSENSRNRRHYAKKSPLKGISQHLTTGRWKSQIWVDGKSLYLGFFVTAEEAHAAYVAAAAKHYGEFARAA